MAVDELILSHAQPGQRPVNRRLAAGHASGPPEFLLRGIVVGPDRLAEPGRGRRIEGRVAAAALGLGPIEPVSWHWRRILQAQDSLTEKRAAICERMPSRASQATMTRWRRSAE